MPARLVGAVHAQTNARQGGKAGLRYGVAAFCAAWRAVDDLWRRAMPAGTASGAGDGGFAFACFQFTGSIEYVGHGYTPCGVETANPASAASGVAASRASSASCHANATAMWAAPAV